MSGLAVFLNSGFEMFKFNFDFDDADLGNGTASVSVEDARKPAYSGLQGFKEINLDELVHNLPDLISYSPITIPLSSGSELTLVRRDLFDARFQLISEEQDKDNSNNNEEHGDGDGEGQGQGEPHMVAHPSTYHTSDSLKFIDSPSDLVPGVYEGGLKTWECSLDLVDYLHTTIKDPSSLRGTTALEIGCGTGFPSIFLLNQIYTITPSELDASTVTHVHLQDYNSSVLQLVTLPNILLNWYMGPTSPDYQSSDVTYPPKDPSVPGELPITDELKEALLGSLKRNNVSIRFFSGSWESFDVQATRGPQAYDVVLTSETIYRMDSLPSLIRLLREACCDERAGKYRCLVAAKVIYFGVGGGVSEFVRQISGEVTTVWERNVGVGRKIMSVRWH